MRCREPAARLRPRVELGGGAGEVGRLGAVEGGQGQLVRRCQGVGGRDLDVRADADALLGAVAEGIAASPADPLLSLRHMRLTSEQLHRLTATLEGLIAEDRETPEDAPTYGFLVALYRHPDPVGQ